MLQQCGFPKPADDTLILTCGPKGLEEAVHDILKKNGYSEGDMF